MVCLIFERFSNAENKFAFAPLSVLSAQQYAAGYPRALVARAAAGPPRYPLLPAAPLC